MTSPLASATIFISCSVDISRISVAVLKLKALFNGPKWRNANFDRYGAFGINRFIDPKFCIGRLLEFFAHLLPFKSHSTFSFWLDFHRRTKVLWALRGKLRPNLLLTVRSPKGASLHQNASYGPSSMRIGLMVWSVAWPLE